MLTVEIRKARGSQSLIQLGKPGTGAYENIGWLVRDDDNWKIRLDKYLEGLGFLTPLIVGEIREQMANQGFLPHSKNDEMNVSVEFGNPNASDSQKPPIPRPTLPRHTPWLLIGVLGAIAKLTEPLPLERSLSVVFGMLLGAVLFPIIVYLLRRMKREFQESKKWTIISGLIGLLIAAATMGIVSLIDRFLF